MPQFGTGSGVGLGYKRISSHPPRLPGERPEGRRARPAGAGHGLGHRAVSLTAVGGIVYTGAGGTARQRWAHPPRAARAGGCGSVSRTK